MRSIFHFNSNQEHFKIKKKELFISKDKKESLLIRCQIFYIIKTASIIEKNGNDKINHWAQNLLHNYAKHFGSNLHMIYSGIKNKAVCYSKQFSLIYFLTTMFKKNENCNIPLVWRFCDATNVFPLERNFNCFHKIPIFTHFSECSPFKFANMRVSVFLEWFLNPRNI